MQDDVSNGGMNRDITPVRGGNGYRRFCRRAALCGRQERGFVNMTAFAKKPPGDEAERLSSSFRFATSRVARLYNNLMLWSRLLVISASPAERQRYHASPPACQ
jgi:hypothetical protein